MLAEPKTRQFTTVTGRPIDPRNHSVHRVHFLERAGVRPTRLHDARHAAATLLLVQGRDQRVAMEMLGWTSPMMTARYQHVVPELVDEASRRMRELLGGDRSTAWRQRKTLPRVGARPYTFFE